ncbi:MAG: hypothetical protein J6X07_06105 [Prevotella sp.]|nr:hypothetical protein [Prevotella sp.]
MQKLIDKYLAGETSPAEEQRLALALSQHQDLPEEWESVRLMLGELTLGEAEYDAVMAQRNTRLSALLIALRIISSVAAIYLIGLFFYLQQEPVAKIETAYNNKVEEKQPAPQPKYCTEGTPREILMCYMERREAQPHIYQQLKQKSYENQ